MKFFLKRFIKVTKEQVAMVVIMLSLIVYFKHANVYAMTPEDKEKVKSSIEEIFKNRNKAILEGNIEIIESLYDLKTKYGVWACEHEKRKMKYIQNWGERQGVKFIEINPNIVIRRLSGSDNKYSANLICSTEYKYIYEDEPDKINISRIGTYHSLQLANKNDVWIITKEWYKDPFADSLNINNLKVNTIKEFILSQKERDFTNLNERRIKAIEYADMYCGAASEEKYGFKYNKKYRDFNGLGGDCANFASQILHEGGKFRKNSIWNYDKGAASRAWVNADGFKSYMLNSGRASLIAQGSYEKVYKASYKLLPGDFVAYEKKGDIVHISVVTGADSRGYSLVTCHNTDRNKVPWDLGWSDKNIKFWLVRVHF
ncbi:amidase domain-containing protein [Clostridium malenominatum]|uniref:Amidase domain-containing protein n=1 Tax=Clostridium malenominatum TaxID=1539 RepID=A0ABN1IUZ5_9CLOT